MLEWPGSVKEIDEKGFDEFVRSYPAVVVDFWGPSCAPCKMLSPLLEGLAGEMKGKVAFGKVDVTKNIKLVSSLMIRSIPTLVFYKDGKKVKETQGFLPKNRLHQELRDLV
jgi:thioredoxin 1